MRFVTGIVVGGLAVGGLISLAVVFVIASIFWRLASLTDDADLPEAETIVLTLPVRGGLAEAAAPDSLVAALEAPSLTLAETIAAIDAAADDPRVVGLITELGGSTINLAQAQEVAAAIARFRAAAPDRPILAFADSLGELAPGDTSVYLAAAHDSVWLRPEGIVGLAGLSVETPFAADGLEMLGIDAEIERRGPYKSFPETFTETGYSAAHRRMVEGMLDDLFDQIVTAIADGRGLVARRGDGRNRCRAADGRRGTGAWSDRYPRQPRSLRPRPRRPPVRCNRAEPAGLPAPTAGR